MTNDEDDIVLRFTRQEFDYIVNQLARCPWGEVNGLMTSIGSQRHDAEHAARLVDAAQLKEQSWGNEPREVIERRSKP